MLTGSVFQFLLLAGFVILSILFLMIWSDLPPLIGSRSYAQRSQGTLDPALQPQYAYKFDLYILSSLLR